MKNRRSALCKTSIMAASDLFKSFGDKLLECSTPNDAIDQIVHENINLFCQAQNNIVSILNDLNYMPEIMKHMPPLPVKLIEELTNSISLAKKA